MLKGKMVQLSVVVTRCVPGESRCDSCAKVEQVDFNHCWFMRFSTHRAEEMADRVTSCGRQRQERRECNDQLRYLFAADPVLLLFFKESKGKYGSINNSGSRVRTGEGKMTSVKHKLSHFHQPKCVWNR